MGIAFSDYLSHDFFPLFIVTVWMCLRQINVLSLSLPTYVISLCLVGHFALFYPCCHSRFQQFISALQAFALCHDIYTLFLFYQFVICCFCIFIFLLHVTFPWALSVWVNSLHLANFSIPYLKMLITSEPFSHRLIVFCWCNNTTVTFIVYSCIWNVVVKYNNEICVPMFCVRYTLSY